MNLVEYALHFRDHASSPLRKFGEQGERTFNQMKRSTSNLISKNKQLGSSFSSVGEIFKGALGAGIVMRTISSAISGIKNYTSEAQKMWGIQMESEIKLATIMRQRLGATDEQIDSIKKLASEQQKLGVIGDEVQLSGTQQLATFVTQKSSIESLLPAMNNLLAQQNGLNATSENAVNIGNLMGKVMQGQTSALTRVGITFTEAQEKVLKYGTEQERAAMLAQVITDNVGEMNSALAATPEGKLKQMSNMSGDVQEQFGKLINQAKIAMLPLSQIGLEFASSMLPVLEKFIVPLTNGVSAFSNIIRRAKPYFVEMLAPAVDLFKSLTSDSGEWMGYIETVKATLIDHIYPVVSKLIGFVSSMVSQLINFIKKSELLKDVFKAIYQIVNVVWDLLGMLIDSLSWVWDKIVMPIIQGIEKLYKWIKGSSSDDTKSTPIQKPQMTPPPMDKKQEVLLSSIAKNTQENVTSAMHTEQAISSGGQKVINITVPKFMDNIIINTQNLSDSKEEILDMFNSWFVSVLANGSLRTS